MRRYLGIIGMLFAVCVMFLVGFIVVEQRTDIKAIRASLERLER